MVPLKKDDTVLQISPTYMMVIDVSRVGPYYMTYCNQFRIFNGEFEVKFMQAATRSEDNEFELEVCKILDSKGLTRLCRE